jgi:hypothetical protein
MARSMGYCRHENAFSEMQRVWEEWDDYTPGSSDYEDRARKRIVDLVADMHEQFAFEGAYDETDE